VFKVSTQEGEPLVSIRVKRTSESRVFEVDIDPDIDAGVGMDEMVGRFTRKNIFELAGQLMDELGADTLKGWRIGTGREQVITRDQVDSLLRRTKAPTAAARGAGAVVPDTVFPKTVQRIEEPDVIPSFDKPHGLYTSPVEVTSPHLDLGGKRHIYEIDPNANVLYIDTTDLITTNRGRYVGQPAGVGALRKLVGKDEATRFLALSKQEAIDEMTQIYPNVQWGKYFDTHEIAEGYGGIIAKERRYDAIYAIDRKFPEFSEFVVLNKNIARAVPDEAARTAAATARGAEAVARPSILKGLSRRGPLETKYFTAFYVRSGPNRGWRIFRKTFDKRSDLHKDIEDAWREGRGGVEEWPKLTIGDEETGLAAQGLATRAEAMEVISRLETQYIDEFLNPVQAARRQQLAVTPETVLPGMKNPLARIPLPVLRERAASTTNPRAFHYKNELARREAITADKATIAAKRKEVEDYLGFYDEERGKVINDLEGLLGSLPEDRQASLNWFFMPDPNDPAKMIIRASRPLSPTQSGYRGAARESATSTHMNRGGLENGGPLTGNESAWVAALRPDVASQSIIDIARRSLKEMGTVDATTGAPRDENLWQIATRRFFGIVNAQEQFLNEMLGQGSDELIKLGAGRRRFGQGIDRPLELFPSQIGTITEPGPLRILYRALHTKGGGKWLGQLKALPNGQDWIRQYYNLRAFTGWEENLRKVFDTEFKLLDKDDYFFRGWKRIEGFSLTKQQQDFVQQRLTRINPITKERVGLSFEEMEALGFEPIFWNPYHQAALSQRMGLSHRLQIQLIDILKNEEYGLARSAATKEEREHLINQGYREVRGLGPAFDGDKITGTPVKFITGEDAMNAVQGGTRGAEGLRGFTAVPKETTNLFVNRYLFPSNVAKGIEDLFGVSRGASMRRQRALRGIPIIGKLLPDITYRYDDLVYLPKRAKLFASLFQQADFAQRAAFGGTGAFVYHVLLGLQLMARKGERAKGFLEVLQSGSHLANIPKHWGNMLRANLSPGYRKTLRARLRSKASFFDAAAIKENPELAEYNWPNLTGHGLHVNDATIFGSEDAVETMREVIEEARGLGRLVGVLPRSIRELEYMLRRGLFEGVYPAAIMHDVQYNILPLVRLAHPDLNPSQIMSIVARDANKWWSSIPKAQSVIQGHLREGGKRTVFSIAENEGIFRTITGMFTSKENARYFQARWVGGFLFMGGVANLIHFVHTGEPLPWRRYIPIDTDWDWWRLGYKQAFLSPDIPVRLSGGENAMLDLVMQQDMAFRVADYSGGMPLEAFMVSRLSVPARTVLNQVTTKDYFGRDIQRWGYTQRMIQFAYDGFAPIGAGQLAVLAAQRRFENKDLPSAGPLLREGATIQDITPTIEARLGEGYLAHSLQGLGLNVRAKSNRDLLNLMTTNTFGDGTNERFKEEVHTNWTELKNEPDKKREIYQDSANRAHVEEIERRRALGTRFDQHEDFTKMMDEERDVAKERLAAEATVVSNTAGMLWSATDTTAWSPGEFRQALKKINVEFAAEKRRIEKSYGADPAIAEKLGERRSEPDDKGTVKWALWKYYNIRKDPKITDELGNINYRAFDAAWEKEVAGWDPESGLEERLNAYLHSGEHHPFVQQYYAALKVIDDSGYWKEAFPAEIAALQGAYPGVRVQEVWNEYLAASMEQRNALRSTANPKQRNAIRVLELARKTHRLNTRYANPSVDALLVMWFHNSPAITQNLPLWQKLYKTAGNLAN
jgi:hypothetical protein